MRPIIPPPVILTFYIGIVFGIDVFSPLDFLLGEARLPIATLLFLSGVLIALLGVREFHRHKTTVHPLKLDKVSAIVTSGIYQWTRNPMYLGMLVGLFGIVAWSQDLLALVAPAAFIVTLNRLQIRPEEHAMREMFGEAYESYCRRTRRWI
ncbi:isoprenylcysteine carboxylmethyltransferase family protein [Hyphobacterium sp. HN65]|uniref:Isoprenylcysteine carboxylmethyltransferase family protein n=1 Tax=Hyphobacterium lacteum TaxID=3116575 RepID=A0ABU7LS42_9PROT|nr:isoprenylcysteine carboxylmethyltransferase family protein [Hyphobacterium sp. HN65]MEE2526737.1 isoprenylcysteine carboxylmethyltransferase family protein [Hyphobacterium sp. HN65]